MTRTDYGSSFSRITLVERRGLRISVALVCGVVIHAGPLAGQNVPLRQGVPDTSAFRPLELPAPSPYRTAAGTPGSLYWQQRVDYSVRATLDTATHTVRGEETIRYTNNAPDTLRYVWVQLDQNLFSPANPFALLSVSPLVGGSGYVIERVGVLRPPRRSARAAPSPLPFRIHATMMQVSLDQPLPPRGVVEFDIAWHFQVPLYWRTGREQFAEGWLYEVGQWFPRMAVYDELRGWNTEQYLGVGEFYLEYGDIDYAITAPAGYTVTGSGVLRNAADVLTPEQRRRLGLALGSDTTIHIIAPGEVGTPSLLPSTAGATRTWRFHAENVRDVAWAAAPNFVWDATGWDGILIQALYPPRALPVWAHAAEVGRFVIRNLSTRLVRYPYPTAINVNGPAGGMEYPMMVFCPGQQGERELFGCSAHEFAHEWFPMMVGSNERLYGWQDEGLVSFLQHFVQRDRFPADTGLRNYSAGSWVDFLHAGAWLRVSGSEGAIMMPQDHRPQSGYLPYVKTPVGLHLLRREIVDSVAFDAALREYVRRWAFKHPAPADFFRTMNDALGEDLSWFWRSWFFRTDHLDLAVDSVAQRDSSGLTLSSIYLSRRAEMVAPVDMLIVGADSSRRNVKLPVQVWYVRSTYVYQFATLPGARPVRVEIDPRHAYPDVDRSNNSWSVLR